MQSLAVIPDIHMRRSVFQHAVDLAEDGHDVVLLGDYVDNGPRANDAGFLSEVFAFAEAYDAVALIGNHDLAYLYPERPRFRQNGYEPATAPALEAVYARYRDQLRFAYHRGRYVFSHAGFSRKLVACLTARYGARSPREVVDLVNAQAPPEVFYQGPANDGGDLLDGPLWLRLPQYDGCWLEEGVLQVTGHSSQSTIRFRENLLMIDVGLPLLLEW